MFRDHVAIEIISICGRQQNAAALHRLAVLIQISMTFPRRCRNGGVHLACQHDEASMHAMFARLPGEAEEGNGNAVATRPRPRVP